MLIQQSKDYYVDVYSRSSSVTGSCTLLSAHFPNGKNFRFLVDCGMFQGGDETGKLNQVIPFNTEKINSVFVTHNHIDHVGLLPLLVKEGYQNAIFAPYATSRLVDIALYDSCRIKDFTLGDTLYEKSDVEKTLDLIVGSCYKRIMKPHKNVHVTFYSNGHLVGAAIVLVQISYPGREDINLVFTGDYNNKNLFFNAERLPQKVRNLNIAALFTESTYGDMDSTDPSLRPCVVDNTIQAIEAGKTVVYPAFSQGRYQEMLTYLKVMQTKGKLPENVQIWGDGYTGQEYTKRYLYSDLGIKKFSRNFLPKNFHSVSGKDKRDIRERIISSREPKIIIAPGGMGHYGSIQKYISNLIGRDDVLIHYLGYCTPESKAGALIDAKDGDEVTYAGMSYIKKCDIQWTGELSAHAKRDELLTFTKDFSNLNSVLITHGEPDVRKSYASYLHENLDESVKIGILDPDYAYRINENGIQETFPSHFQI